jgi:TolB-like protein
MPIQKPNTNPGIIRKANRCKPTERISPRIFNICTSLLILLFLASITHARPRIAVLPFRAVSEYSNTARIIPELIATELFHEGAFDLFERIQIQEILKQQALHLSGCTEVSCAVEVGRLLSVENVLIGTLDRTDNLFILNAKIIDVQSGKILATDNLIRPNTEELFTGFALLAKSLALQYGKESAKLHGEAIYFQKYGISFVIPDGYSVEERTSDNSFNIQIRGPNGINVWILMLPLKVTDEHKFMRDMHSSYLKGLGTSGATIPKKSILPCKRTFPGLSSEINGISFDYYFGSLIEQATTCENYAKIFQDESGITAKTLNINITYRKSQNENSLQELLDSLSIYW